MTKAIALSSEIPNWIVLQKVLENSYEILFIYFSRDLVDNLLAATVLLKVRIKNEIKIIKIFLIK